MYKVRFFWGNEKYLDSESILTALKYRLINPVTLIQKEGVYLLPEEWKEFSATSIYRRETYIDKALLEVKFLGTLFFLYFFYLVFFDFDYEKISYVIAFASILCLIPLYIIKLDREVIKSFQKQKSSFISRYRAMTIIESSRAYLPLIISPIIIYLPASIFFQEESTLPSFLYNVFKHNSLLHWALNFTGLIWCIKIIEGRFSILNTLLILITIFAITFCLYKYIHVNHGNGLSGILYALLPFVVFISYEVRCFTRLKEYIGSFIILTSASLLVLSYIDTIGHLLGLFSGIAVLSVHQILLKNVQNKAQLQAK
ncbi:rhomboid family intramembrane serine protease [Thalassotalea hakodatensis]|uniref:rhomboid family intramembrane serine protease n=1 Tax=Thalassotalea hakodatensis TaxID=3030492 RepID=UPI00257279BE|nr:rhomboid family intramembrane serine protease [Thalassotalea hakodatensis]